MNRRDFVVYGAAAAAGIGAGACALAGVSARVAVDGIRGPLPYKAIFDARFHSSCSFGAHAARLGCAIRPITGDVTALWFEELQPLWVQRKGVIVGMTTAASLLCLEQLAWDQWMRVVARVEHRPEPDGTLRHRLFLHGDTLQAARVALAGDDHWAGRLVAPLAGRLAAGQSGRPVESVVLSRAPSRDDPRVSLVSWVIAARSGSGAPIGIERLNSTEVAPI